jgi:hypothetical protein
MKCNHDPSIVHKDLLYDECEVGIQWCCGCGAYRRFTRPRGSWDERIELQEWIEPRTQPALDAIEAKLAELKQRVEACQNHWSMKAGPTAIEAVNPKLCERCQKQPPQLQGGWYSDDTGQWVSCKACNDLRATKVE